MVMKQQYEDEIVRLRRQLDSHPLKGDPDSRGGGVRNGEESVRANLLYAALRLRPVVPTAVLTAVNSSRVLEQRRRRPAALNIFSAQRRLEVTPCFLFFVCACRTRRVYCV